MLHLHFYIGKGLFPADVDVFEQSVHVLPNLLFVVSINDSKLVQLLMQASDDFVFRPAFLNSFPGSYE